jgi:hypothetical protein
MANRKKISNEEMRKRIHALRGSLERKPGDKSFTKWMAELNREEKALEEARFARLSAPRH